MNHCAESPPGSDGDSVSVCSHVPHRRRVVSRPPTRAVDALGVRATRSGSSRDSRVSRIRPVWLPLSRSVPQLCRSHGRGKLGQAPRQRDGARPTDRCTTSTIEAERDEPRPSNARATRRCGLPRRPPGSRARRRARRAARAPEQMPVPVSRHDVDLGGLVWIPARRATSEPIEPCVGQRERPLLLDRILVAITMNDDGRGLVAPSTVM